MDPSQIFPRLINVLRSEMGFVGPRPELDSVVDHYPSAEHQRHHLSPESCSSSVTIHAVDDSSPKNTRRM